MTFNLFGMSLFNVTEKSIQKYLNMDLMQGAGTKNNPYYFTDLSSLPTHLSFWGIKSHILLDRGLFDRILITYCQNIRIRNTKAMTISLKYSTEIIIEDSEFKALNLKRSKGNIYRNNSCTPAVEASLEKKQRLFPYGALTELIMLSVCFGLLIYIIFLLSSLLTSPYLVFDFSDFSALLLFIIVFFIIALCLSRKTFKKNLRPIKHFFLIRRKSDIIDGNDFNPH